MKKLLKKFFSVLLVFSILIGIGLVLYPTVSNLINDVTNKSNFENYDNTVKTLTSNDKNNLLSKAKEYNRIIASKYFNSSLTEEYKKISNEYENIMNFGEGIICYIDISKINVSLPVYHETVDNVLTKGSAHLKNSSFPLGEKTSHTVISAHSGFPQQKFFDDLDELKKGDTFRLRVLSNTYYYKVKSINIVNPNDNSKLKIIQNKDLVTLVTCYPYSINTHRLLVTGERYIPTQEQKKTLTNYNKIDKFNILTCIILLLGYSIILWKVKTNGRK